MEVIENWGQEVLIPSFNEWEDILETALFLGNEVVSSTLKTARFDIDNFKGNAELFISFVQRPRINSYVRLLRLNDEFHRIHIEDVICEHCHERSGYSATPYLQSYEGPPNKSKGVNGLIRRYLPKGTDMKLVHPSRIKKIENLLNNRPRRCLGYKTPNEVYDEIISGALLF